MAKHTQFLDTPPMLVECRIEININANPFNYATLVKYKLSKKSKAKTFLLGCFDTEEAAEEAASVAGALLFMKVHPDSIRGNLKSEIVLTLVEDLDSTKNQPRTSS
jgi:hypothetical protein